MGIEVDLALDPEAGDAFPTGIALTEPNGPVVTITQKPFVVDWPPDTGGSGTNVVTPLYGTGNTSDDLDGDGFTVAQGDCDDTKASVYPGALEVLLNGIDEDCDGSDTTHAVMSPSPSVVVAPVIGGTIVQPAPANPVSVPAMPMQRMQPDFTKGTGRLPVAPVRRKP